MIDAILERLETLEKTLRDVRKNYHINLTELGNLKGRDQPNTAELNQLKLDFVEIKKNHGNLIKERDELKDKLDALDDRYQALAEAHHMISEDQEKLQQQIDELTLANENLKQKNRVAADHTKVVLERLTQIDKAEK